MFAHSIRWRLQFWLGLVLFGILFGFGLAVYRLESINRLQQLDAELERRLAPLHFAARASADGGHRRPAPPDDEDRPHREPVSIAERQAFLEEVLLGPRASPFFEEADTNGLYFAIWSGEGDLLISSKNAPPGVMMPDRAGRGAAILLRTRGNYREASQYTAGGEALVVGQSLEMQHQGARRFLLQLLLIGTGILIVGIGGGWWITTRAIRPIEQISTAARRISAGNLSERVTTANPENEIGRLAEVLNDTFARLEAAFMQQKRFVADAAHELRTPLAVMITEAQSILSRQRSPEEYRESIEESLGTAQQMRGLIESLLELAHLESDRDDSDRGQFDLADTARSCTEQLAPLAAKRAISIDLGISSAPVLGDEQQIRRVITNLLSNAIHYNHQGGNIRLETRQDGELACLRISNTGVAIDEGDLPFVFDRFFRADKARSRADGRSGLGLAISKAIVDAHGGTIDVKSEGGETTFEICLPIRPDKPDFEQ